MSQKLTDAISALYADGINSTLINKMTEEEILRSFAIEDYGDYNRYMTYMARKYDI